MEEIVKFDKFPNDKLLEVQAELEFFIETPDSVLEYYEPDFKNFTLKFNNFKSDYLTKLLESGNFEVLSELNLDNLGIKFDTIETIVLKNLDKTNYKKMKKLCEKSWSLANCRMICDIVMIFSKVNVEFQLISLKKVDKIEEIFAKAISNIIDGNTQEDSIYYLNVAYSLKLSSTRNVMKLLNKMLFDLYALRIYLSGAGPYQEEFKKVGENDREIDLASIMVESLIRE